MSSKRRISTRSKGRKRLFIALGVAALIVVDGALVAFALSHGSRPDPGAGSATAFPAPPQATPLLPEPSGTPTESASPTTPAGGGATVATIDPRLLAISDDGTWYRATPGGCSASGAELQVSTDAGFSWSPAGLGYTDASMYLQVVPSAGGYAEVVYADADCNLLRARTFVAGAQWQESPNGIGAPTFVSGDGTVTIGGIEETSMPCAVPGSVSLAADGVSAALVCDDGLYVRDASGSWTMQQVSGVLDVAATGSGWVVAREGVEGCAGVSVESVVADAASTTVLGCAETASIVSVTVAAGAGSAGLWSGDDIFSFPLV